MQDKKLSQIEQQAKKYWDEIAKPIDSLGLLEDMVAKLCAISGSIIPGSYKRRALLALCADHGVVEEGVTQTDQSVTKIVAENMATGCSSVNYMAGEAGVDVFAVDVGMKTGRYPEKQLKTGVMVDCKVAYGTRNLAKEAAMTEDECARAIETGEMLMQRLKALGYEIVALGEMGIGNTTPTSALAAAFLSVPPDEVTGRGAGLDDAGLCRKKAAIARALARVENRGIQDAKTLLAELGGLEIAAMTGVCFGAMHYHLPVVLDGAITCVAALVAETIEPGVSDYLFASHQPEEASGKLALEKLGLPAVIHGRLCLGEGTGAMMLFPLLDMALSVYRNMGTFSDLAIDAYSREGKPQC